MTAMDNSSKNAGEMIDKLRITSDMIYVTSSTGGASVKFFLNLELVRMLKFFRLSSRWRWQSLIFNLFSDL